MRARSATLLALLALAVALAGCDAGPVGGGDDDPDAPDWAPAARAKVRPGVQTRTGPGGQCTSNFVFYDGDEVYLGQAAHCSSTGGASSTNGCRTRSRPLGTKVRIEGASRPGTLVYNSWLAMARARERDREACQFNDFALVRIDAADRDTVNPSVPRFGGPTGLGDSEQGDRVFTYGNSQLRLGIELLRPRAGLNVDDSPGGWNHVVYTITPGVPGDSGSGYLNGSGQAFGVLSTLQFSGRPLSNGVGDLRRALDYARSHGFEDLKLAEGTEKFRPSLFGRS